jgi:hypothetical protein
MPTRKPRGTYPNTGNARGATSAPALRRRADAYRDRADELEAILKETQDQFTDAFAAADSQLSTRDRINDAARKHRRLAGRNA